jgi:hypothetical protein
MIKLGDILNEQLQEKSCWRGYVARGTKKKGDRMVPNCVPLEEVEENQEKEMIQGIAEILRGVKDVDNRKKLAIKQLSQLKSEGINIDEEKFFTMCDIDVDEYDVEDAQDIKEFVSFMKENYSRLNEGLLEEAEYQGRKVTLGKPFLTPDGPKKRSVYVKNAKGNVVKVNFGQKGVAIKKHLPKHRKSYRARHGCKNPGPRWKANYWSCKAW